MVPALLLVLILAASLTWLWRGRLLKDRLWWWAWAVPAVSLGILVWLVAVDLALRKAVGLLAMPAGLTWLALIAGCAVAWRAWNPRQALAWCAVLLLYTAAGNAWLGGLLIGSLERRIAPVGALADLDHFDAVAVLGGGSSVAADGSPQLGSCGDRIVLGARLYFTGKTFNLIASGGSIEGFEAQRDVAAETATLWRNLGIAASAIHCLPTPRNTTEEIAAYRQLCAERGWKRIGLVSSAWHLPRVLALSRRHGLEAVPLPADWRGGMPPAALAWLIPQEKGFSSVQLACYEYLALALRQ